MPIHGYPGGVISATSPTVSLASAPGVWTLERQAYYQAQGLWPQSSYPISKSVRLRSSASAYFNRTLSTPTNNKIWTWSAWLKRGTLNDGGATYIAKCPLFDAPSSGSTFDAVYIRNNDYIVWYFATGGATTGYLESTAVFRDPSAWYHLVFVYDSTQATASNRMKVYVNGSQIDVTGATYVAQNTNSRINSAVVHKIGAFDASSNYADCYLTEINFIDGQALTPTSFGGFDTTTGVWNPKAYTGTYGNNGFYLNFKDATSTTTIGYDYSGNSNNWTSNGVSVTAGSTYDSMVDTPTNYGTDTAGTGATARGNYAVLNPLDSSAVTVSNGNLRVTYAGSDAWRGIRATMPVPKTGSWKWEVIPTTMTYSFIGLAMPSATLSTSGFTNTYVYAWYLDSGEIRYSDVNVATGKTVSVNDVVEVRVNNATVSFYKNNTLQWTFTQLLTDITPDYFPVTWMFNGAVQNYNFGQQPFVYTVAGYQALCTQNLSTPTISNGAGYMAATLYTGNGSTQSITNTVNGVSFQPDFTWFKNRSGANNHALYDSVRGRALGLKSNDSGAEETASAGNDLVSFNSNGVSLGPVEDYTSVNGSGQSIVLWNWKASGTTVSNTTGSITSTVNANTTAGFSILTYTGNGTVGATVGHGLGATPGMVIVKSRSAVANWPVKILPYMTGGQRLELSTTNATTTESAGSGSLWNATNPNSTVITLGNQAMTNTNGTTYVAYCFAPITGYSAFGSYVGNGSTDGTFVYCGFRPRWILAKSTSTGYWHMFDSSRPTYNPETLVIYANIADAEATVAGLDFLSNGFKLRYGNAGINGSGDTILYAAFAENPFTISRAR